jgi:hypothetical protein
MVLAGVRGQVDKSTQVCLQSRSLSSYFRNLRLGNLEVGKSERGGDGEVDPDMKAYGEVEV